MQQLEFESENMPDIDQLLNAIEWTSLYEPLPLPVGIPARLEFAKRLAKDLATQPETLQSHRTLAPGSSPVDLLFEGPLG